MQATLNASILGFHTILDREEDMAPSVPVNDVFATMQATFGSLYVNDFTLLGRNFQVNLQSGLDFETNQTIWAMSSCALIAVA